MVKHHSRARPEPIITHQGERKLILIYSKRIKLQFTRVFFFSTMFFCFLLLLHDIHLTEESLILIICLYLIRLWNDQNHWFTLKSDSSVWVADVQVCYDITSSSPSEGPALVVDRTGVDPLAGHDIKKVKNLSDSQCAPATTENKSDQTDEPDHCVLYEKVINHSNYLSCYWRTRGSDTVTPGRLGPADPKD